MKKQKPDLNQKHGLKSFYCLYEITDNDKCKNQCKDCSKLD